MKKLLCILLMGVLLSFTNSEEGDNFSSVHIVVPSRITIIGTTNVNKFHCKYETNELNTIIPITYHGHDEDIHFDSALLLLKNVNFDCGGRGINRDFNKLLRTEEHPYVKLDVKRLYSSNRGRHLINAEVAIQIADVTNDYNVEITYEKREDKLHVSGVLNLNLIDFGIEPPTKAMGMIKVKEEIKIEINLFMELKKG